MSKCVHDSTVISIRSITLMETHKQGKRIRHPQRRTVTGMVTEMSKPDGAGNIQLTITAKDRQFEAELAGTLNNTLGTLTLAVVNERVSSYLKKKRFRVVGYTPDARRTNLNKKPQE
jgi:hypothetical protein